MQLTEDEQAYLASLPDVTKRLAVYNRRQAVMRRPGEIEDTTRDSISAFHVDRARRFEALTRG